MTNPYAYADDTVDDNDHKNDSYIAAVAAPGASIPCSLFLFLCSGSFVPVPLSKPFGRMYATFGRSRAALGRF